MQGGPKQQSGRFPGGDGVTARTAPPYIKSSRRSSLPVDHSCAIPKPQAAEGVRSHGEHDLPPPLLTVQELALLLATSSSGVYSRVARGQLSGALRIGRSLRFDPRVIAEWLLANKASAGGLP